MDTLTFDSPILLRHLTFSEAKKLPISEIHLETALKELDMDMDRVSLSLLLVMGVKLISVYRALHPTRM